MFAGHYAPAYALARPGVPLWKLFFAAQAVDVLFFGLVALGVESLVIDPTKAGNLALTLAWMPWSHSLVAAVGWALLLGLATRSWEVGAVTASHWVLDLPMHLGDLPLVAGGGPRVGLGLWAWPAAALSFELLLLAAAVAIYARRAGARRAVGLGLALLAVQAVESLLLPLPTVAWQVAAMSEASYLGFTGLAWWAERGGAARG